VIYYVTIVDMSEETGISRWDYIHPETPSTLFEHLKEVRDYIPPMTYGIVSVVSKDLFGDRLRRMEFSDMQIIIGKIGVDGREYYVFFIADIRDHHKAVWRTFMEFFNEEKKSFERILSMEIVDVAEMERLRNAFSAFLVDRYRKNPTFGARDMRSLLFSFMISMLAMGLLALLTWYLNHVYGFINRQEYWLTFTYIIIVMHFILPGPIIGYITQYRKHSEIICITSGILWALIISWIYHDILQLGIWNSFHIEVGPLVFYTFALISGLIYGAALMVSTIPFACMFEWKYLTTPREILIGGKFEKKKEEEETVQVAEETGDEDQDLGQA